MHPAKHILPVAFLVLLFIPVVSQLFGGFDFEREDENRAVAEFPEFSVQRLDPFPGQFDDWYGDAFAFRAPLLDAYQEFQLEVFRQSPSDKTLLGKDGWMYLRERELEILQGRKDFPPSYLPRFVDEWQSRLNHLDSLHIPSLWMIVPMKHRVVAEGRPFNLWQSPEHRMEPLMLAMDSAFPGFLHHPLPLLQSAQTQTDTYYRNDNHWNFKGAEVYAKELLGLLQDRYPEHNLSLPKTMTYRTDTVVGGFHARAIGRPELYELEQVPVFPDSEVEAFSYEFPSPEGFPYPWEYEYTRRNPNGNGLTILLIGDSYSKHLRPYLSEVFSETVMLFDAWQYDLHPDIIERVQPDIVVWQSVETLVEHVIGED